MDTTTTYSAKLPGIGIFRFAADLSRAETPIYIDDADGNWHSTQYQTADARHRKTEALRLALRACGREFFGDPNDERDDSDILDELLDGVDIQGTTFDAVTEVE
jgi:hypothetical protein